MTTRTSVYKSIDPKRFESLVTEDVNRRFESVEWSKRALIERGVPPCYWVYLDANQEHYVAGNMLGTILKREKDMRKVILRNFEAKVFHIIPKYGKHVPMVVDVRDNETISFYLANCMDDEEYQQLLNSILGKIEDNT